MALTNLTSQLSKPFGPTPGSRRPMTAAGSTSSPTPLNSTCFHLSIQMSLRDCHTGIKTTKVGVKFYRSCFKMRKYLNALIRKLDALQGVSVLPICLKNRAWLCVFFVLFEGESCFFSCSDSSQTGVQQGCVHAFK